MSYTPLNVHTHLSFLQALSKPKDIAKKLANYNISSCLISDYDLLSGCVQFYEACKKNNIKPLLGTKVRVEGEYLTLIAKNFDGWKELMRLSSKSYDDEHFIDDKPTIKFEDIFDTKNLLVLADWGFNVPFMVTELGDRFIYQCRPGEWRDDVLCVAAPKSLYVNKEDINDYKVLLSTHFETSYRELPDKLYNTEYETLLKDDYSIKTYDALTQDYSEKLLKNTNLVSDMCEDYNILSNPRLPHFDVPKGYDDSEYLRELCRDGWRRKITGKIPVERTEEYVGRIKHELDVMCEANLSSYFLIVQDVMNYMKNKGVLCGIARGSAGGCLISYLTNITEIDPVKYDLLFERFYNAGRNTKEKVSLPDIDCDFPPDKREEVIQYFRDKYGDSHVAQVVTFARLQGRGALKEVLRIHGVCNRTEMDNITSNIPQGEAISDKLEEQKEDSIIRWTLNNEPEALENWCKIENGEYTGDYAKYFEQAIRLEGTYKSYGKHASAVIVCGPEITELTPMIRDKSGRGLLVAFENEDAEKCGTLKLDVLGVGMLRKLMDVNSLLRYGKIVR